MSAGPTLGSPGPASTESLSGVAETRSSAGPGVLELDVEVPVIDHVDEWYLEVRETKGGKLVTVIEVLSPTNKLRQPGRKQYLRKREKILESRTSLVEIDLLRAGRPMPLEVASPVEGAYRILVSRGKSRPRARLYVFGVRQPIPAIPIPLLPRDAEPALDLNSVLHDLYNRARFDLRLDYTAPAPPPLTDDDVTWGRDILGSMQELVRFSSEPTTEQAGIQSGYPKSSASFWRPVRGAVVPGRGPVGGRGAWRQRPLLAGDARESLGGPQFPWATFAINVSGSFAIGLFSVLLARWLPHPHARLLVVVGFLGGYTTFSSFSFESLTLWERGEWGLCLLYMVGSVACGFRSRRSGNGPGPRTDRGKGRANGPRGNIRRI